MIYPPDKLDSETTLTQPLLASSMLCINTHTLFTYHCTRLSLSLHCIKDITSYSIDTFLSVLFFIKYIMRNNTRYINTDIFDSLFSEIFWQESMDHITPAPPADKVKSTITTPSTEYPTKRREATKHYQPTTKTVLSSKKLRRGLCHNCKKTEDSTWRLDPKSKVQLCNACGL